MPAPPFATVDDYIAAQPERTREVLARVRRTIRDAVPDVTETIAYNMPTFKHGTKTIVNLAAWKNHYGLYLSTKPIVELLGDDLQDCTIEKGTIRFALDHPVPTELIARIVRLRTELLR